MQTKTLLKAVLEDLDDLKALNVSSLDVHDFTSVTDYMVIATGNSNRHVRSLAENILRNMKERHVPVLGTECDHDCEWALVDLGDVVVHIMQARTREFYQLERLWSPSHAQSYAKALNS